MLEAHEKLNILCKIIRKIWAIGVRCSYLSKKETAWSRSYVTRSGGRGGGIFWTRPKACKGVAAWEVPGGSAPRTPEKFSKFFSKNRMKNYNFRAIFQNFNENFAIFTNIFKNFSNFSRKFGEKIELCSSKGFRGRSPPPDAGENFKIF